MCTTCGCGHEQHNHEHEHEHHGHEHSTTQRVIELEQDILSTNNRFADEIRDRLAQLNITALNLLSSPGSGKTTLLEKTIEHITNTNSCWVIEGDQQTSRDADRIKAAGATAIQINTGKACHLDAHRISHALDELPLTHTGYLFIENVGNLVCPASFDLGEKKKVVLLSVTEGEDKPIKYPDMFHVADLIVINKSDLLPYVNFNLEQCIEYAKRINPRADIITLSCQTGEGLEHWFDWLASL